MEKNKILLHTCCAPCGAHVIQALQNNGFEVSCFFYNPNIHPIIEYEKRRTEIMAYLSKLKQLAIIAGDYEVEKWFRLIKGLEQEPERGRRCQVCYRLRLEKTAQIARENNFAYFASTLSVSPHKDALAINQIGRSLGDEYGLNFYEADWKKKDGYKKSCEIAKEENFYRQRYCGCVYSWFFFWVKEEPRKPARSSSDRKI